MQRYNNFTKSDNLFLDTDSILDNIVSKKVLLGNNTNYNAKSKRQAVTKSKEELSEIKYTYKQRKSKLKKSIGKKVPRCGCCGTRTISKDQKYIKAVQGESGGIYYKNMQRCGSVWFCPDCAYKLMKTRSAELYLQLQHYREQGKKIIFVTFTLQHHKGDRLADLHKLLLGSFAFANSHRRWKDAKKKMPIEFLRTLEVLYGVNGAHPHLHCAFIVEPGMEDAIKIFTDLYEQYLRKHGKLINEHTTDVEEWNGKLETLEDYMFKDMLEHELTSAGLKKSGQGKTFYELVEEDNNHAAIDEYIEVMKGKRQYHHSKGFFKDVRIASDEEILKNDKVERELFKIPKLIYADINAKDIALDLLNEYEFGGVDRAKQFLEFYNCDSSFLDAEGVVREL